MAWLRAVRSREDRADAAAGSAVLLPIWESTAITLSASRQTASGWGRRRYTTTRGGGTRLGELWESDQAGAAGIPGVCGESASVPSPRSRKRGRVASSPRTSSASICHGHGKRGVLGHFGRQSIWPGRGERYAFSTAPLLLAHPSHLGSELVAQCSRQIANLLFLIVALGILWGRSSALAAAQYRQLAARIGIPGSGWRT